MEGIIYLEVVYINMNPYSAPLPSTSLIIISAIALVVALWVFVILHFLKKEDALDSEIILEGK
jgi:uncharacterized protein HemY